MIAALIAGLLAGPSARAALRWGVVHLAVILLLLSVIARRPRSRES